MACDLVSHTLQVEGRAKWGQPQAAQVLNPAESKQVGEMCTNNKCTSCTRD